jgi:hypothetical protein
MYKKLYEAIHQVLLESDHPMIEVDGVLKHRHNSLGQPIHHTDDGIKNFHRWFTDSQAVDQHGRPKVYYHGTNQDFMEFNRKALPHKKDGLDSIGSWFTDSTERASDYGGTIMPVYLNIKTPMVLKSFDELKDYWKDAQPRRGLSAKDHRQNPHWGSSDAFINEWGHIFDGVRIDAHGTGEFKDQSILLTFNPEHQVKSAIGNSGSFSHPTKITESTEHPMIEVDGEMKHRHNSLGQPIHHTDEGIKNFHRWFGDSKAVDQHGRPKVYYHGTAADIPEFSHKFVGHGHDQYGSGFYFIDKPDLANMYATDDPNKPSNGAPNVIPVYLRIKKPIDSNGTQPLSTTHIRQMISAAPDIDDSLSNFGDVDYLGRERVLKSAIKSYVDHTKFKAMNYLHNDFYDGHAGTFLQNMKKITGHDAVVVNGNNNQIVSMFHPEDIKSAIGNIGGQYSHPTKINESKFRDPAMSAYNQMVVQK